MTQPRDTSGSETRNGSEHRDSTHDTTNGLKSLPSVEEARLRAETWYVRHALTPPPRATLIAIARMVIARARGQIQSGLPAPSRQALVEETISLAATWARPRLRAVINAGGAILNTNLGRAPLSQRAIAHIQEVASGYSNLEFDLDTGERGSRQTHIRDLLRNLTGAEDAIAVNNNAAATLLALAALAAGREVIVSRGELVEIGGGFRIPDILAQSGAHMVEVGTTNRVRLDDYASAITTDTALILSVHPSNFRIMGFTAAPTLASLAALSRERNILLIRDLGSGALLDTEALGLGHEDTVSDSLRAGVDAVCFSGDKLLGGPQAGIIAGKRSLIERIERHPLARAVRCDKLTLAALEGTLQTYLEGSALTDIPIWAAIATPLSALEERARAWVETLAQRGIPAIVTAGETTIGGGSLPGETLPTALCAIPMESAGAGRGVETLAQYLRTGEPAVLPRVSRDQLLLDPRTVHPSQDVALLDAITQAWNATNPAAGPAI